MIGYLNAVGKEFVAKGWDRLPLGGCGHGEACPPKGWCCCWLQKGFLGLGSGNFNGIWYRDCGSGVNGGPGDPCNLPPLHLASHRSKAGRWGFA